MNITKSGLYDNYPIYYVQELKRAGRRDMAMAFMDYWDDYRSEDVQAKAYYAKVWHSSYRSRGKITLGISRSVASSWIEEFTHIIAKFEASWKLFEATNKGAMDRSVEKSIEQQSNYSNTNKSSKRPNNRASARNQPNTNRTSIDTKLLTSNNINNIDFSIEDLEVSKELLVCIKELVPNLKEPNIETWARECKQMREEDSRSIEQIKNMMKFIYSDEDSFGLWDGSFFKGQIMSMKTLRSKYDQMSLQIKVAYEKENR